MGLLLLRVAVGVTVAAQGVLYLSGVGHKTAGAEAIGVLMALIGAALVVGFLTPVAGLSAGLCVLGMAFSWFPAAPSILLDARLSLFVVAVTSTAIVLLGPGAFSLDGYLFGRREIVIPPRPPES
jgi:uncharacterized membrane protein YphA (DoxX/SURF4 family)